MPKDKTKISRYTTFGSQQTFNILLLVIGQCELIAIVTVDNRLLLKINSLESELSVFLWLIVENVNFYVVHDNAELGPIACAHIKQYAMLHLNLKLIQLLLHVNNKIIMQARITY